MPTIAFYKPYGVLSQFTPEPNTSHPTLADFIPIPNIYPAGRLDHDSEGLLILTSDGALQARLTNPRKSTFKTYWAQVENIPSPQALGQLETGVTIQDYRTLPATARLIEPPPLPPRVPPIRYRAAIPTAWIELRIREGKNRQVRRMTAAVGHPTLRLVRYAIANLTLHSLSPGQYRTLAPHEISLLA